ncbi:TPA: DUF6602 domain-containing protein [Vibrio alginolyticus]
MAVVNNWAKAIEALLKSSFSVSSSIANHSAILGDARESFIRSILKSFLPSNLVIGSGQIIDSEQSLSKQIDIIIYRDDFPILRTLGTNDVYLVEGVLATIEVKSRLNKETLYEALDNCKSVRDLRPTLIPESLDELTKYVYGLEHGDLPVGKQNSVMGLVLPPTYIFAYEGYTQSSLNEFLAAINEWYSNIGKGEYDVTTLPDVIVSKGCVSLKNLNDSFSLGYVKDEEIEPFVNDINANIANEHLTVQDLKDAMGLDGEQSFTYGLAAKGSESPIQYFISDLLTSICFRQGIQKFGSTPITYSLLNYVDKPEYENDWVGVAVNINCITRPSLDYVAKLRNA